MPRGDALTGPVARGDTGTVQKHLLALQSRNGQSDEIREIDAIYRVLAQMAIRLAREHGLEESKARELSDLLEKRRP
jgi:predicted short-subunit dehydrogenase-like oxidoreductase (DUF2520 family)